MMIAAWTLAAATVATVTLGTETEEVDPNREERTADFGVEFRLGPYGPRISDNRNDRRYFRLVYGGGAEREGVIDANTTGLSAPNNIQFSLVADWYVFDLIGQLGLSGGVGFWTVKGRTRSCVDNNANPEPCPAGVDVTTVRTIRGNTPTRLTVIPLNAGLVYRFDLLDRRWGIPFVPYVRGGVDYYLWWDRVDGEISESGDREGMGATAGYHGAVGLAINLSFVEPRTAAAAARRGIAGTFLTGEYRRTVADHFGRSNRLEFSDMTWSVGLGVQFY